MKPAHKSLWFRMEYGIVAAIIIGLSGQFLIVVASALAWCILRAVRPGASTLPVIGASIFAACMALSVVDMGIERGSVPVFIEDFLAATAAFFLLFQGASFWAYLLIAHSLFTITMAFLSLRHPEWAIVSGRSAVGTAALNVFIMLLLVEHLRTGRPAVLPAQPPPHENG